MSKACEIMAVLKEGMERLGWPFEADETEDAITCGFRDENGNFGVKIIAFAEPACALILCELPVVVPEHKRGDAADAMNRVNFTRPVGTFEMEPSSGRLFCKASLPIEGSTLTFEQFLHVILTILSVVSEYHRAFARLIYGDDLSPAEVVAEVEMAMEQSPRSIRGLGKRPDEDTATGQ